MEEMVEQVELLLEKQDDTQLQEYLNNLNISDVEELIGELPEHGPKFIETLSLNRAVNVFRILEFPVQERIIKKLSGQKLEDLINELPPDDRTSLFSELHGDAVQKLIQKLSRENREEALKLLGYEEESVGRLMTPDYIAVKRTWDVSRVLSHIRRYGKNSETIDVIYVIDEHGVLLDDIRIREILLVKPETKVSELMDGRLISLSASDPQEEAINVFRMNNRTALPVVDNNDVLLGIVTVDDILWIANEEYTEDIQKIGGTEALDEPYLDINLFKLIKKRVGWLIILFLGEMLTATAMGYFGDEISKVVVLAYFIPLIISSGGNSGSQASTLIIQAMALGEVTVADWWRVMRREILSGLMLGVCLGLIGFLRIAAWSMFSNIYGPHWMLVGFTVGASLIGIVLWGSLSGSMLPLLLKKLGADPATSSAPFVATLVDVTGLIIYFTIAVIFMRGILL
ncbi:magnesium transporter [Mucilaginibacter rubeus]|uniref:Magnesium transporter MgtE n=1 Tax=Mucilaginibacter rubeus TaxID=2027860 RepID=A0AAE6JB38_9SPHI|nr:MULTISPECIES: magnesium transporter [Mucilaginibacter]QEM02251.1 magnesium transporter [Mucilaginibacter rubeus]QEM14877.1 magnesium transporter [Mucilaginibacter gossypii]QTE42408.1 magnesium transporter [Mucilaginibacter rubeus]QTE49011.1 magnesium transporter [Mucilaginibacter rubeus]QTE54109.1 magnesium transporter [Mucilaginibacter rubeus]